MNYLDAIRGKKITRATLIDNELTIEFYDGSSIVIYDAGQDCCEERYIHTDDNINALPGNKLINIKVLQAADITKDIEADDRDCHEICFLHIITDTITVVLETHNIHNGYYGGFKLVVVANNLVLFNNNIE